MIEYYPPVTTSEWIQAIAAAMTFLIGFLFLLVPKFALRMSGQANESIDGGARTAVRSHLSGVLMGFGMAALLLQQPLLYLALGAGWGFATVTQIVSIVVDANRTAASFITLMVKAVIASFVVLSVLGYFG